MLAVLMAVMLMRRTPTPGSRGSTGDVRGYRKTASICRQVAGIIVRGTATATAQSTSTSAVATAVSTRTAGRDTSVGGASALGPLIRPIAVTIARDLQRHRRRPTRSG